MVAYRWAFCDNAPCDREEGWASCRGWDPVTAPDGIGFDAYIETNAGVDLWVGSTDERSQQVLLSVRIVRRHPNPIVRERPPRSAAL
jgi:hypothetical protein